MISKYALYEKSVQSPKFSVDLFAGMYKELRGSYARHLREDFCGTFAMSCEWVKRNRANTAVAVDLDPEPLAYGRRAHLARLNSDQRSRIVVARDNVMSVRSRKSDLIIAGNFSFYVFKERETLLRYFRACHRGLAEGGILLLEMAGGPGMIESTRESKGVFEKGKRLFTYVWDQKSFDPITHRALYSIHFKFPNGRERRDAFVYDWRLWTIPEVRDAMREAGFRDTCVYWETEHQGEGTGEYTRSESGDNAFSWIAYAIGMR